TPASLSFAYQTGASAPPSQNITLTGPATAYSATATSTGNWLQIANSTNPGGGTSISGTSPGTITASVVFSALAVLPPGTSNAQIMITPSGSSGAITIPVTVFVTGAPPVTVTPSAVSLAFQIGGTNNNASQTLSLSSTGIQGIPFTLQASVDNNPSGRIWF